MSLIHFQSALAQLIRLPEHNRNNSFVNFIQQFDLDSREKSQLEKLSEMYLVQKYGNAMSESRLGQVLNAMFISQFYVSETRIDFWRKTFF